MCVCVFPSQWSSLCHMQGWRYGKLLPQSETFTRISEFLSAESGTYLSPIDNLSGWDPQHAASPHSLAKFEKLH